MENTFSPVRVVLDVVLVEINGLTSFSIHLTEIILDQHLILNLNFFIGFFSIDVLLLWTVNHFYKWFLYFFQKSISLKTIYKYIFLCESNKEIMFLFALRVKNSKVIRDSIEKRTKTSTNNLFHFDRKFQSKFSGLGGERRVLWGICISCITWDGSSWDWRSNWG